MVGPQSKRASQKKGWSVAVGSRVLVYLDYQVGICGRDGILGTQSGLSAHTEERGVLEKASDALQAARRAKMPVIHVGVAFEPSYQNRTNRSEAFERLELKALLLQGSNEAAFNPEVAPRDGEHVVYKGCVDAFVGTHLLETLIRLDASDILLGGTATNFAVESTARHAGDIGFQVTVLEDLCASYSEEMHEFAIERTLPTFARIAQSTDRDSLR